MPTSLLHPNRRKGRKPDTEYLEFIRRLPCCVCKKRWWSRVEAAHVGHRGLGQKSNDRETIPLCTHHHTGGKDAAHRLGKNFWATHNLNRAELIAHYQKLFAEREV